MNNLAGTMSYPAVSMRGARVAKWVVAGFWISTAIFALQMGFTAYAQLRMPQVAGEFARLGFPGYFRVELSWAKCAGLAALLVPWVPARVKEWAYAGFLITLVSAVSTRCGWRGIGCVDVGGGNAGPLGCVVLLLPQDAGGRRERIRR